MGHTYLGKVIVRVAFPRYLDPNSVVGVTPDPQKGLCVRQMRVPRNSGRYTQLRDDMHQRVRPDKRGKAREYAYNLVFFREQSPSTLDKPFHAFRPRLKLDANDTHAFRALRLYATVATVPHDSVYVALTLRVFMKNLLRRNACI